jgi:hypothetical protein
MGYADNVQEENVGNEPSASSQPTHPKAGVSTEGATVDTLGTSFPRVYANGLGADDYDRRSYYLRRTSCT